MAVIAGKDADVSVGGYTVHAHKWSMDINAEALDVTAWDWEVAGWKDFIAGLKGWSGSFECFLDDAPTMAMLPGSKVAGIFYVKKSTGVGFHGLALITKVSPGVDITGVETMTFDFTGCRHIYVGTASGSTSYSSSISASVSSSKSVSTSSSSSDSTSTSASASAAG